MPQFLLLKLFKMNSFRKDLEFHIFQQIVAALAYFLQIIQFCQRQNLHNIVFVFRLALKELHAWFENVFYVNVSVVSMRYKPYAK